MQIRIVEVKIMELEYKSNAKTEWKDVWKALIERNGPYEWFVTLTFHHPDISHASACKRFNSYVRRINEDIYGRRYRERGAGINFVRVMEYQRLRGAIHFHCLMGGGVANLDKEQYEQLWHYFKRKKCRKGERVATTYINGEAKIDDFDPLDFGIKYILKQIEWGDEIDISNPSNGQQSIKFT